MLSSNHSHTPTTTPIKQTMRAVLVCSHDRALPDRLVELGPNPVVVPGKVGLVALAPISVVVGTEVCDAGVEGARDGGDRSGPGCIKDVRLIGGRVDCMNGRVSNFFNVT